MEKCLESSIYLVEIIRLSRELDYFKVLDLCESNLSFVVSDWFLLRKDACLILSYEFLNQHIAFKRGNSLARKLEIGQSLFLK